MAQMVIIALTSYESGPGTNYISESQLKRHLYNMQHPNMSFFEK